MIEHQWQPPICYYTFRGQWTWSEFYETFDRSLQAVQQRPTACYAIWDLTYSDRPPVGMVAHMQRIITKMPPNLAAWYVVGADTLMADMIDITLRYVPDYQDRVLLVGSIGHAHQLIEQRQQARGG